MNAAAPTAPAATRPIWAALVGVPLLLVAAALLQRHIDSRPIPEAEQAEQLMLRSPAAVKKLSLGYESLLADIYWTRAVQYYGARLATPGARFPLLWPLLDVTTTLDPHLIVAYRFGSIFLSEGGEIGAGQVDKAIELVRRGIASNPSEWRLYTDLGFLYYWRLGDYADAASAYAAGSEVSGAPVWVQIMAARIADKGGSLETSRLMWAQLYDSTQDPAIRKMALQQAQGLAAQEDENRLNLLAAQYRQRLGRFPSSSAELKSVGLLVGIPVDPAGFPYVFGSDGKARLAPNTTFVMPPQSKLPRPLTTPQKSPAK